MNVIMRHTVLILFMWLMLAGVCLGKQVYLKDGGIIEARSAWRQDGKVFVNVNRDIVADFNQSEIDLRRTFPKSGSPSRKPHRKVATAATAAVPAPTPAPSPAAATAPAPAAATAPPPTSAAPAPKPAGQPNAPAVSPAPKPDAPPSPAPAIKETPRPAAATPAIPIPQQDVAAAMAGGVSMSIMLAFLAIILLIIAAQWVIFERAGQAGWKCLVPFYNMYILMLISGKPGWWMFLLFVPLVGVVVFLLAMLSLAKKFGRSELFGVGIFILPMIFLPLLAFGGSQYEG